MNWHLNWHYDELGDGKYIDISNMNVGQYKYLLKWGIERWLHGQDIIEHMKEKYESVSSFGHTRQP